VKTEFRLAPVDCEDWEALYERASSLGHGELVEPEEERVAATDELLAAVMPAAARTYGRLVGSAFVADSSGARLAREIAAILHVLDAALAAHGRDHGYDVTAWRAAAVATADVAGDEPLDTVALLAFLEEAVRQAAGVFVALSRDRFAVSERLADALAHVLVVFAALSASP
jgi:hypothetical protein